MGLNYCLFSNEKQGLRGNDSVSGLIHVKKETRPFVRLKNNNKQKKNRLRRKSKHQRQKVTMEYSPGKAIRFTRDRTGGGEF